MSRSKKGGGGKLGLKELIAMGVGGMVGGGIFSVLGLAIAQGGHGAPVAFALGGVIAMLTGLSYTKLALAFRSDGGSFTYMEYAFSHRNIASIGGWLLLVGYIGTLALYAYTFGAYGTAALGTQAHAELLRHLLESAVLLVFLGINLYGVKTAGSSEDVVVVIKVGILVLFAAVGLFHLKADHVLPIFDKGAVNVLVAAALIFVAYEGFELIANAVREMKDPDRDLARGILLSIAITITIYILVSLVAVGTLRPEEIIRDKEYALAVAAKPFLGHAGFLLIGLAALLSTASAINATLFGTARLSMVMAQEETLPKMFALSERSQNIPWVSLLAITGVAITFVNVADLTIISSFASSTFLLIFAIVNLAAFRLRARIGFHPAVPIAGFALSMISWAGLVSYMWRTDLRGLVWIGLLYLAVAAIELLFSERRMFFSKKPQDQRRPK